MVYTEEELRTLCAEWQKVLRLQDWEATVTYARYWEFDGSYVGRNGYLLSSKTADIKLLDPLDHGNPNFIEKADTEVDLVHELVHLHFAPFMSDEKNSPIHTAQEQAIDLLAKALVSLKRGNR